MSLEVCTEGLRRLTPRRWGHSLHQGAERVEERMWSLLSALTPGQSRSQENSHGERRKPGRQWHPTPALLPGKSHGWRSMVGYSPWGRKEWDTTERLHFHFGHTAQPVGSKFPNQGLNPHPRQCGVLTTGLPRNFGEVLFKTEMNPDLSPVVSYFCN